jgi:hypothetical protein
MACRSCPRVLMLHSAAYCICNATSVAPNEAFLLTPISTRRCTLCGEVKPLTAKHFHAVRAFVRKFSFYCISCDAKSKTIKRRPEGT